MPPVLDRTPIKVDDRANTQHDKLTIETRQFEHHIEELRSATLTPINPRAEAARELGGGNLFNRKTVDSENSSTSNQASAGNIIQNSSFGIQPTQAGIAHNSQLNSVHENNLTLGRVNPDFRIIPKPEDQIKIDRFVQTDFHQIREKLSDFREKLEVAQTAISTDIKYHFDKALMDDKARLALENVAVAIKSLDGLPGLENYKFTVAGHTDSVGSEEYNQVLSEKRANDLRDALIDLGVNPNRVVAVGHGESQPKVANELNPDGSDNPEARAINRRAELEFGMTEVKYQAYLLKIESELVNQSSRIVEQRTVILTEKIIVAHLDTIPPTNNFSNNETATIDPRPPIGAYSNPEMMKEWKQEQIDKKTEQERKAEVEKMNQFVKERSLANALNSVVTKQIDLELNIPDRNLGIRANQNDQGNYLVSVFDRDTNQALNTTEYNSKGAIVGNAQNGLHPENSTWTQKSDLENWIRDGIRTWHQTYN